MIPSMLLCTLGTSLFYPNLEGLKTALSTGKIRLEHRALAEAYTQQDWTGVAQQLTGIDPEERLCGAEINSIASLLLHNYIAQITISPRTAAYFFCIRIRRTGKPLPTSYSSITVPRGMP